MGRPPGTKNKPKLNVIAEDNDEIAAKPQKVQVVTSTKKKAVKIDYDRQAALEEESDMLHIPPDIIPDGMRYNWKTLSVFGQQQTRRYGRYQATGWEPVPASRHPGLFTPKGFEGEIEYDGLILMEKPEELCRQTEAREFGKARQQVQAKEQQLRGGDAVRSNLADTGHQSARKATYVQKSYERIDVPEG
jgi:hypothetical protein